MIPLVLITGFLGSGKTTLVSFVLEQARRRRLACIVNEFGSVDIDGQLLDLPADQLVSIPGGSIFCRCLVGEFIRVLRQIASLSGNSESSPLDAVIVEASGMADPRVAARMLTETQLDEVYSLRRVVSVVDPVSFAALVHTLPSIIGQVEASDLVLVNKTDLYDEDRLSACEAKIREFNPGVEVLRTQFCRAGIDLLAAPALHSAAVGEYAACRDPNYFTRTIHFDAAVALDTIVGELKTIQPHVYRGKGFVPTPAGRMYVDVSAGGVECRPAPAAEGLCEMVLLAAPQHRPAVESFVRRIQPGAMLDVLPDGPPR